MDWKLAIHETMKGLLAGFVLTAVIASIVLAMLTGGNESGFLIIGVLFSWAPAGALAGAAAGAVRALKKTPGNFHRQRQARHGTEVLLKKVADTLNLDSSTLRTALAFAAGLVCSGAGTALVYGFADSVNHGLFNAFGEGLAKSLLRELFVPVMFMLMAAGAVFGAIGGVMFVFRKLPDKS